MVSKIKFKNFDDIYNLSIYPFWRRSILLVNIADFETSNDEIIELTLPVNNIHVLETVMLFFKYGCLPHGIRHYNFQQELEIVFKYLAIEELRLITYEDSVLNNIGSEYKSYGKKNEIYDFYNVVQKWENTSIEKGLLTWQVGVNVFPVVFKPSKLTFKIPLIEKDAIDRILVKKLCPHL